MAIPSITSASVTAVAGIRRASERLDNAAANLVSETVLGSGGGDRVSLSAAGRAAATNGGGASADSSTGDIAQSMVDLRIAKYQNAASIAVLRTADEMTDDLISLGKR